MDEASLVAQMVKNLPAMQETQVRSLGCINPLEKGMATHASILAWRIPWMNLAALMNLGNTVLSKRSQSQKTMYYVILLL